MDIPPQSRSLFLIGLGGVLVGAALGYMVRGDAPAARGANPPEEGRKKVAMTAEVSGAAPVRVESRPGEKNAPDGGDGTVDFVAEMRGAMKEVVDWERMRRLHATIDRFGPAEIEAAVSQLRLLPTGQRDQVAGILGARWAAFDPAAAMAFARKLGRNQGGWEMMRNVFQKWAEVSPDAAGACLETLPPGQERKDFTRTLLFGVTQSDPARALQIATRLNLGNQDAYLLGHIFSQWAAENAASATGAALALPAGRIRESALSSIAGSLGAKDPAAALAWAGQLSEPRTRRNALSSVAGSWAQNDPAAAFAWAQSVSVDAATRRNLVAQTLNVWMGSDPAAAQAQILALSPGAERNAALSSAIQNLGRQDLATALQLLGQLPEGRLRTDATRSLIYNSDATANPQSANQLYEMLPVSQRSNVASNIANRMAQNDVAGALQWAAALPAGQGRKEALRNVTQAWAENDPRAAVEWVLQNEPPTKNDNTLSNAFGSWVGTAPDDALNWAMALPPGETRDGLSGIFVAQLANTDPQRAIAIFSSKLSPEVQAKAAYGLAVGWANTDSAAATAWVGQLPAGEGRSSAMSQVVAQWAAVDPAATAAWLDHLPAGDERDGAIRSFSSHALDTDPEGALAWAATIANQNQRTNQIESLAETWLRNDADAARKWLAKTDQLTPERKAQLLKREER